MEDIYSVWLPFTLPVNLWEVTSLQLSKLLSILIHETPVIERNLRTVRSRAVGAVTHEPEASGLSQRPPVFPGRHSVLPLRQLWRDIESEKKCPG